jgi:chromate transporter
VGFTLPSAALMFLFGLAAPKLGGPWLSAVLHGLALTAAAIVAQATWSLARRLTPDILRLVIAAAAGGVSLLFGSAYAQIAALACAAAAGALTCRAVPLAASAPPQAIDSRVGAVAVFLFLVLLVGLPLLGAVRPHGPLALAGEVYRTGALVFGGGHVVLPLLRDALVPQGWLSDGQFLGGYGAAQALPGPLFAVAAFIGEAAAPAGSSVAIKAAWAGLAVMAIFLPGLLLVLAGAPIWTWIVGHPTARGALTGVNAGVVGLLAAALYSPIGTSAIVSPLDLLAVAAGLALLLGAQAPPLLVAAFGVACAMAETALRPGP